MTIEEYKNLTDEERLNLINKLEEEKEFSDKALEKFLRINKKDKSEEKEKWISLTGMNGGVVRVSDIEYIETTLGGSRVVTKKVKNGIKLSFESDDSAEEIFKKINGE